MDMQCEEKKKKKEEEKNGTHLRRSGTNINRMESAHGAWTARQRDACTRLETWARPLLQKRSCASNVAYVWGRAGAGKSRLVKHVASHVLQRPLVWYHAEPSSEDAAAWRHMRRPVWTCDCDAMSLDEMIGAAASMRGYTHGACAILFQSCAPPPPSSSSSGMPASWTVVHLDERDMRPRLPWSHARDPVVHDDPAWHACASLAGVGAMDDQYAYAPATPFPVDAFHALASAEGVSTTDLMSRDRLGIMAAACIYHVYKQAYDCL